MLYIVAGFSTKGSPKPNRVNRYGEMGRSSKGVIPQAKIRTIKMTFFIVLGKQTLQSTFLVKTVKIKHLSHHFIGDMSMLAKR